ncbi:phytanoyl-CoA dioxygenase family protein [Catenulispora rubra]|uniref:phytanoyl-CoA dioxygenase family protein n=1 Tax=Catenulispora rubra TaxID=280293 RepID=UPI0018926EB3|nr:phytanoyl-CoA dioxygenase family protein [Catenulispora rubra]
MANGLLGDRVRLRALFADEGYLFFRGVLDAAAVRATAEEVVRTLVEQGLLDASSAWAGKPLTASVDTELQDALNSQQLWERLVAVPAVAAFFAAIAGAPVGFIPLARYRIMPPGGTTQAHQDALLNPGFAMTTAWIPLMAIGAELGGLAVVRGSHRGGCVPAESLPPLDDSWLRADYQPGDVVLMHEALAHTGLPNRSPDGVRVSIDVRFQHPAASAAVVGRITAVDAASIHIASEDGGIMTLGVDASTLLRNSTGAQIPLDDLLTSDLTPGRRIIASRRDGHAIMIKPL